MRWLCLQLEVAMLSRNRGTIYYARSGDIMEVSGSVKIEFRTVKKEAVKDIAETVIVDLASRKDFDQKLRELRKDNYVLEYQPVK